MKKTIEMIIPREMISTRNALDPLMETVADYLDKNFSLEIKDQEGYASLKNTVSDLQFLFTQISVYAGEGIDNGRPLEMRLISLDGDVVNFKTKGHKGLLGDGIYVTVEALDKSTFEEGVQKLTDNCLYYGRNTLGLQFENALRRNLPGVLDFMGNVKRTILRLNLGYCNDCGEETKPYAQDMLLQIEFQGGNAGFDAMTSYCPQCSYQQGGLNQKGEMIDIRGIKSYIIL